MYGRLNRAAAASRRQQRREVEGQGQGRVLLGGRDATCVSLRAFAILLFPESGPSHTCRRWVLPPKIRGELWL